ncbi:MAG TPA: S9 family peptidase [Blastocatellia bacterium]|nr:S9 family peptidase [Blastocatellia bacterium]
MNRSIASILLVCFLLWSPCAARVVNGQPPDKQPLSLDDLAAMRDVAELQISPDGNWVAYTVRTVDVKEDKRTSDIWMTRWDGSQTIQLTFSKESEQNPRWSPDNKYLSFLAGRGGEAEASQVWLLNRAGGEAEKLTDVKGGVSDYYWSPDSRRMILVVRDPDPEETKDPKEKKAPKPIVINRYEFKRDIVGYITTRHQHLYLFDVQSRKIEPLTTGDFDETQPAWSPDGSAIAFVSKRGKEPDRDNNSDIFIIEAKTGAAPRQLTTYAGSDSEPAWSPDGKTIAYIQGGPGELIGYAVRNLTVIPVAGGQPKVLTSGLDRNVNRPQWSRDGSSVYCLLEDDRTRVLAQVPAAGGPVKRVMTDRREISGYEVGDSNKIALISSDPLSPREIFAVGDRQLRQLTHQNQEWLSKVKLGSVEEISFKSKDGTAINGFVTKPPDYVAGRRYPTLLRIHGGPVSQFSNQFDFEWQLFAAHGYVVVTANPRGSSGRGQDFSKTIYADWGNKDAQDVLAAVDYVVAQGIADPDKLGIGGWSYGGMLTNYTIAQDTRFKVAVSGASISNIIAGYGTDQYIRDYEAELGPPWKSLEKWLKISFPFLHADKIVTPTLFLCGEKDFNVPLLNSEQMYQALKSLGRDTELVIYPGQFHGITRPSYVRDRYERYLAWYDKYLMRKGGPDSAGAKESRSSQTR